MKYLMPEFILVLTALVVLAVDLVRPQRARVSLTLAAVGVFCTVVTLLVSFDKPEVLFGGRLVIDGSAVCFKLFFLLTLIGCISLSADVYSTRKFAHGDDLQSSAEYVALLLFSTLGMMMLVGARDIISLYVALELSSMPLFLLAAWGRHERGNEAALKFVTLGALGSAILLLGLCFLYGAAGAETSFARIAQANNIFLFCVGLLLTLVGAGYKLALVPMHMWAPDVYDGSPAPVVAFLSLASKGGWRGTVYGRFDSYGKSSECFLKTLVALLAL